MRPAAGQVDDLLHEIRETVARGERVLVTTLTKRMAEDLTDYYRELGIRVKYLHSDIDTIQRMQIIRDLRLGEFDVLVGINLLREGLDIPEVSLVAILDADKEGFLRSARSLIQTCGRAARNLSGRVIMYADKVTGSMQSCIDETNRRRAIQTDFNVINNITPQSVRKSFRTILESIEEKDYLTIPVAAEPRGRVRAGQGYPEAGKEAAQGDACRGEGAQFRKGGGVARPDQEAGGHGTGLAIKASGPRFTRITR